MTTAEKRIMNKWSDVVLIRQWRGLLIGLIWGLFLGTHHAHAQLPSAYDVASLPIMGTVKEGSANQFGQSVIYDLVATNSLANSESGPGLDIANCHDPSDYSNPNSFITRDCVGRQTIARGQTPPGTLGRFWGASSSAYIFPGSDGLGVGNEIDMQNWGSAQPEVYTTTSKYGAYVVATGNADISGGFGLIQGPGTARFARGFWGDTWSLDGPFIELRDASRTQVFRVTAQGKVCQSAGNHLPEMCQVMDGLGGQVTYNAAGKPIRYLDQNGNEWVTGVVNQHWVP